MKSIPTQPLQDRLAQTSTATKEKQTQEKHVELLEGVRKPQQKEGPEERIPDPEAPFSGFPNLAPTPSLLTELSPPEPSVPALFYAKHRHILSPNHSVQLL